MNKAANANSNTQTYISAITAPGSISIVGPALELAKLYQFAQDQGLQVEMMDICGKVHNPENKRLARELCDLCDRVSYLRLPEASALRASVRSNRSGNRFTRDSLTEEVVNTILASRCEWYDLLNEMAEDLQDSGRASHTFVIFGMNDCVPMSPFHKRRLQVTKSEACNLIQGKVKQDVSEAHQISPLIFPEDAIAVTGISCRLPGANNLEELW